MELPQYFKIVVIICLCCLLFSIWIAPSLPGRVATHWGLDGKANGFSDRGSIAWIGALPLVMAILFYLVPKLDPLWEAYGAKAREKYWVLVLAFSLFLFAIVLLTVLANLNYLFEMGVAVAILVGLLFVSLGYYFEDCKPSWFVGIRTPWTISSEDNWSRTHKLGAKLFYAIGAALIVCAVVTPSALVACILLIVFASLGLFAYSYFLWRKEKNSKTSKVVSSTVASASKKGKKK